MLRAPEIGQSELTAPRGKADKDFSHFSASPNMVIGNRMAKACSGPISTTHRSVNGTIEAYRPLTKPFIRDNGAVEGGGNTPCCE